MTEDIEQLGARDRILHAAMTMLGEDPATRLSVRAVAERAAVSTGSLRHHFPTQRQLQDEVLRRLYDVVVPDDLIHDRSVPARTRLIGCMEHILAPDGVDAEATRRGMRKVYEQFILPEPTDEIRAAYGGIEREARRRTEAWLAVLAEEGVVRDGDRATQVELLLTVVNGLGLSAALPGEPPPVTPAATLALAVDAVLVDWGDPVHILGRPPVGG